MMRSLAFGLPILFVGLSFAACGTVDSTFLENSSGAPDGTSSSSSSGGFGSSGDPTHDGGDSSDASGGPSCATGEAATTREPVYIDIILDGSQSMDGHGSKSAGCDNTHPPASGPSVCFVADAREEDTRDPERTLKVCHEKETPADQCPQYIGLTGKKWLAIREALIAFFDDAKERADTRFGLGMYLFGSEIEKPNDEWDVEPAFVNAAQLNKLRERILPPNYPTSSGTPLRGSMQGQAPLLKAFTPKPPLEPNGKRVLVVVTDGAASDGKDATITEAENLLSGSPSVTTFVIGVGDPEAESLSVYDATFLSKLAFAGGAAPPGCNKDWDGLNPVGTPCHFQITPDNKKPAAEIQKDMTAAMLAIAAKVQSCELALNKSSPIDPAKVNVIFTSGSGKESQVPKDATNGWGYDNESDPSKIILKGAACSKLKDDVDAKVSIVIGCPTGTDVR